MTRPSDLFIPLGGLALLLLLMAIAYFAVNRETAPGLPRGVDAGVVEVAGERHVFIAAADRWLYGVIDRDGNARTVLAGINVPAPRPHMVVDGKLRVPTAPVDTVIPLDEPELLRVVTPAGVDHLKSPANPIQLGRFLEAAARGELRGFHFDEMTDRAGVFSLLMNHAVTISTHSK